MYSLPAMIWTQFCSVVSDFACSDVSMCSHVRKRMPSEKLQHTCKLKFHIFPHIRYRILTIQQILHPSLLNYSKISRLYNSWTLADGRYVSIIFIKCSFEHPPPALNQYRTPAHWFLHTKSNCSFQRFLAVILQNYWCSTLRCSSTFGYIVRRCMFWHFSSRMLQRSDVQVQYYWDPEVL